MKYIPGLNGLRAIAVLAVIFMHWRIPDDPSLFTLTKLVPDGRFGVNLFFVLSGFLISAILFIEKSKISETHPTSNIIKGFYARRFIRIFPVYYLTLLIIFLCKVPEFNTELPYHLTYTTNFYVFSRNGLGFFSHAWSLAVEEQFYLIWPFVVLYTKKKNIVFVLVIFILIGPASSFLQTYAFKNSFNAYILTPECVDAFGIGALLAFFYTEDKLALIKKPIKILLPFSVFLFFYLT